MRSKRKSYKGGRNLINAAIRREPAGMLVMGVIVLFMIALARSVHNGPKGEEGVTDKPTITLMKNGDLSNNIKKLYINIFNVLKLLIHRGIEPPTYSDLEDDLLSDKKAQEELKEMRKNPDISFHWNATSVLWHFINNIRWDFNDLDDDDKEFWLKHMNIYVNITGKPLLKLIELYNDNY